MRQTFLSCLFILTSTFTSLAGDIEVKKNPVPANSFAVCKYKLEPGDSVQWIVVPEPVEIEEVKSTEYAQCHFNGPSDTKYIVYAFVINFDKKTQEKKRIEVALGKAPPKPVDPVDPPKPDDPVVPVDAFKKAIQDAYTLETASDKLVNTSKLAALYKQAATVISQDANIKNYGQLFDTMKAASKNLLPETAIPKVRAVIGSRLNPVFGAANTPIDRVKVALEFTAIADALSSVK